MSYTVAAAVAVLAVLVIDLFVTRTRLVCTLRWWLSYAIIAAFQLLTNGWLTGRSIVTYRPDAILGGGAVRFIGDWRLAYAPVEDLGFGFALVLLTLIVWSRVGGRERR
ncbi:lycopene cyclase domain-containing protein [Leekyejoonella antrihumi]|uniref:Lycopene cyclase domain-containing protein n=1 Tax=Leekyejoonella antrihumi TaxID=1660198 RepID=A0A563E406_9MICO|nr:lycopene cyclase domain-containing protein [Leekyejoonella antrihumi]TWP36962.1 lycopene cyclase domain-containing protein [Leekyejoonella antrihumi]